MAYLSLSLLGTFRAELDGKPIAGFTSNKARALLAFLAVEAGQPHERARLAGLLWPDWPEPSARANLRRALANLRQILGDRESPRPCLLASRQTVRFDPACDHVLDVAVVRRAAGQLAARREPPTQVSLDGLELASALCRGEFLAGFCLDDCPDYEEWQTLTREQLRREQIEILAALTAGRRQTGSVKRGLDAVWRWVELDPISDAGHRELLRLLALAGQSDVALSQFERYRARLRDELDAAPPAETTRLYEEIKSGAFTPAIQGATFVSPMTRAEVNTSTLPPLPFTLDEPPPSPTPARFVARSQELAALNARLDRALAGDGQVVFVTGDAGSGKTMLVHEFARRAHERHDGLLVAIGGCNERTGVGDPYLPFREVFAQLTGDIEATWAAGAISPARAARLWESFPACLGCVVREGPDLLGTFVRAEPALSRAVEHLPTDTPWLERLRGIAARKGVASIGPFETRQADLLDQAVRALGAMARLRPLLLILDDLQWADAGSVSLLLHLGRRLAGSRLLVVGAFRPADVARGRDGQRHPLESAINELEREYGDLEIDLSRADGRAFVDEWLATEPNRLGEAFCRTLFELSAGHPLFTVELLRGMQTRGDLVRDDAGCWVVGPTVDWDILPARVEAAIAEQVERLPPAQRELLSVAGAEGERFSAEIIARVLNMDPRLVVASLGGELERRHDLVRANGVERVAAGRLSRYRFRHILFQRYLYGSLSAAERVYLHEAIAGALEAAYGEQAGADMSSAAQLAWHFEWAGLYEKAVSYLTQAGTQANVMLALAEATGHFAAAERLMSELPAGERLAGHELQIRMGLASAYSVLHGAGHPLVGRAYTLALAAAGSVGDELQIFRALLGLRGHYWERGDGSQAAEMTRRLHDLAAESSDPGIRMVGRFASIGASRVADIEKGLAMETNAELNLLTQGGDMAESVTRLEECLSLYTPDQHPLHVLAAGLDLGVVARCQLASARIHLGLPDQGARGLDEAIEMARELAHPATLWTVLSTALGMFHMLRDSAATRQHAEELITLGEAKGTTGPDLGFAYFMRGRALAMGGEVAAGIEEMRRGMAVHGRENISLSWPNMLALLGEWLGKAGQVQEGLDLVAQGHALRPKSALESEFLRIKGELILLQPDVPREVAVSEAEACFRAGIESARAMQRLWRELLVTLPLGRLLVEEGRRDEARELLSQIYGRFSEGFDTAPLREAKALLDQLATP